jgi:hypothetical protein
MVSAISQKDVVVVGGWQVTEVTPENTALLIHALSDQKHISSNVYRPICIRKVTSVKQQVVSGIKYKYEVRGCSLLGNSVMGECGDHQCIEAPFEVTLYYQPWTHTLEVTHIEWLD